MLKVLFIPDINGSLGRQAVAKLLPRLKKKYSPDFIIANGENLAHGSGPSKTTIKEMMEQGINCFTAGDHAFDKISQVEDVYNGNLPVIRPANFPPACPGKGFIILPIGKSNKSIAVINLIGRVFMKPDYDCPFRKIDEILANPALSNKNISAIIVDVHAEATSEKISLWHYINGKASAVLGTHTHVMTADAKISSKGTAYITDAGMVGSDDGVIGVDKDNIIKNFVNQIKYPHIMPEKGLAIMNAVFLHIDEKSRQAKKIKTIIEYTIIK